MMWKDVVGYEGIYEVSKCGQVRTKKGKTTSNKMYKKRVWKQRTLKQKVSKDNTCRVSLWKDGKERTWLVHRIVAKAFVPRVAGKEYINHIDGNRLNNHVSNLEWCDHTENNNHAFDTGLIQTGIGIVLVDKETRKAKYFRSLTKASEFLGFSHGYLSRRFSQGEYQLEDYEVYKQVG